MKVVPAACRSLKEILIGYDPRKAGRFIRHPFIYFKNEAWLPTQPGHFLIRALHHYATDWESPFTRHVYETEVTSVQLNMVYLHMWLLNYHLGRPFKDRAHVDAELRASPDNKARTKIDRYAAIDLQRYLIHKEHVKLYTNTFDDMIHEELKRQYRVIDHSLSALFVHSPRALSEEERLVTRLDDDDLEELILYNILNEEPEARREQVKRISDYIRISVHEEDKWTFTSRIESYYYEANIDGIFKEVAEEHKLNRYR